MPEETVKIELTIDEARALGLVVQNGFPLELPPKAQDAYQLGLTHGFAIKAKEKIEAALKEMVYEPSDNDRRKDGVL